MLSGGRPLTAEVFVTPSQASPSTPVRVAIVGTGAIARGSHLPALRALAAEQPLEIVAAVDVDAASAEAFCADAGTGRPYTDLDLMLAEQRPGLVTLGTPPRFHRDQAIAALRAGAWVWCEKPPCPSLEDFDAIEAAEGPEHGGPYAAIVETEDVSTALVRFENGTMATIVNSVLSPDEVSRIRIDCERATAELTHLYGHRNADWRITPAPGVSPELASAWQDFGADVPSSHEAQLRGLLADLRAGRRPRSSGADGRTSLELVAALYKAAFTGKTVRAGEIGPGDPYYSALHGDAPGWAPEPAEAGA